MNLTSISGVVMQLLKTSVDGKISRTGCDVYFIYIPWSEQLNTACRPDSHCWDYFPGVFSLSHVTATHAVIIRYTVDHKPYRQPIRTLLCFLFLVRSRSTFSNRSGSFQWHWSNLWLFRSQWGNIEGIGQNDPTNPPIHYDDVLMSTMASLIIGFLLNSLCRHRSKETSKLRVTGLCEGNSPLTGEFPSQRASDAVNVSIWWRHYELVTAPKLSKAQQNRLHSLTLNVRGPS